MTMHLMAVRNSQPYGPRAWNIVEPVVCALIRMLEGTSDREEDLWEVVNAINLTWMRCCEIPDGRAGQDVCALAGMVLSACEEKSGGRSLAVFPPEARQNVIDAVDLYEDMMRKSSPLQMEKAQKELAARIMAKPAKRVHRA